MKKIIFYLIPIVLLTISCDGEKKSKSNKVISSVEYSSFGDQITDVDALSAADMMAKYANLTSGDTLSVKFTSSINEVCSKKGCWMKLNLEDGSETMVRFKDYGFFMPLDSKGKEVIVEGKAFVKEVSVEDLKHYAEDAGKSKEEIDAITQPKKEFAFEAVGVLMKK